MTWGFRIAAILSALFLIAPTLIVVPMSFGSARSFEFPPAEYSLRFYEDYFSSPEWLAATVNSLIIALGTSIITMLFIVPASFAFVRYKFQGKSLLNLAMMSPLIVPHVVTALADYRFLAPFGLIGTHTGLIMAHSVLSVPVAFLVVTATLKGFDRNLERAAMMSGAGPLRTFWHVTLPVLKPGMMVGAAFAFLQSFNEPVVAIFIAGRRASTLPKKMFESVHLDSDPVLAVVSTLLISVVMAGVLITTFWGNKGTRHAT